LIGVMVAHDGAEALGYLFGTGAYADHDTSMTPRVILLDLKLPKVDGLEVLRRLRTDVRTRHLPVVILTSSDEEQGIIDSYIRKPVDFAQFNEAVRQLKQHWLLLNKAPPMGKEG
jgi:two-component system response regulator